MDDGDRSGGDYFEICRECGGGMKRMSEENQSPLIAACQSCGHREYAEIQSPPPWPADEEHGETRISPPGPENLERISEKDNRWSRYDSSGTPVTVGDPDEDVKVIPVGWILIPGMVLAAGVLLVLSC